ncbi:MoaD/ThiS family protein [Pedobacter sp. BMA]|uniref:MoaD/ThiS family protein n=1 Tax=Pedobacter sp. BMA TaxID=1663685 RepID=UPI00064AA53A|nr:MoaD/ThiS family protein [Pedobacter sp. BMA]KLT64334.1 molybdopterin converting factor, small subunit [Pedobacter sp. BMA]
MEIELISFGRISEFIPNQKIQINGIETTSGLQNYLEKTFPQLAGMKYKLALNKNLVQQESEIRNGDSIAIMPPFSGG